MYISQPADADVDCAEEGGEDVSSAEEYKPEKGGGKGKGKRRVGGAAATVLRGGIGGRVSGKRSKVVQSLSDDDEVRVSASVCVVLL